MKYKVWSLASGIGGLDLAFAMAGFDIVLQAEIDPYCQRVLAHHAPKYWKRATQVGDVRNVAKNSSIYPDVIIGGFPCQDISIAGNTRGITPETRSGLWYEFARIISDVRPRVVFLENVSNIIRVGGSAVIASFAEMGYNAVWMPLQAAHIGAPHQRERWWCIAWDVSDADPVGQYRSTANKRIPNRQRNNTPKVRRRHARQLRKAFASDKVGDTAGVRLENERQCAKTTRTCASSGSASVRGNGIKRSDFI